jgi:very-short-patch-repair endonuclease
VGHDLSAQAAAQYGVFSRAQALAAGYTTRQVRYRVSTEQWHIVLGAGLTAVPAPHAWRMLVWAAHLTHPGSVVSHVTAARWFGWPLDPCRSQDTEPIHVSGPKRVRDRRGMRRHELRVTPGETVMDDDGLVLTSPRRTALDTLSMLPLREASALWAWLSTREIIDRRDLGQAVRARTGLRGVQTLLQLWTTGASGAVNEGERRVHELLARAGLTGWTANEPITFDGRIIGVADVLFRTERLIVEFDGFAAHSTREAFVRDRRRQNDLVVAGYRVLRITWDDVMRHSDRVIRQIRAMLRTPPS